MGQVLHRLKDEFMAVLPSIVFFFVALHLVALVSALMLEGTGVAISTSASVTVASLILGKAVLIADKLPLINRYPDRPLIYNIVWKTLIYLLVAGLIHYLERLSEAAWHAGGLVAGNDRLLAEMVWTRFWAIQTLLFILIFMYCMMHELVRVMGPTNFKRIFFGPLPPQ